MANQKTREGCGCFLDLLGGSQGRSVKIAGKLLENFPELRNALNSRSYLGFWALVPTFRAGYFSNRQLQPSRVFLSKIQPRNSKQPRFLKQILCTGYAVFCCAVLENLIATSSVNVCMMTAIRQSTTFNTGKFPNPYLASLRAQGSALHKRRARRCTIRRLGAAQVASYAQTKGFC